MKKQILRCCLTSETNTTQLLCRTEEELCQWWSWGFQFPEVLVTWFWQVYTAIITVHSSAPSQPQLWVNTSVSGAGSSNIHAKRDHETLQLQTMSRQHFLPLPVNYSIITPVLLQKKTRIYKKEWCLLYHDSHPPAVFFFLPPSLDFPQDL